MDHSQDLSKDEKDFRSLVLQELVFTRQGFVTGSTRWKTIFQLLWEWNDRHDWHTHTVTAWIRWFYFQTGKQKSTTALHVNQLNSS